MENMDPQDDDSPAAVAMSEGACALLNELKSLNGQLRR